MMRDVRFLAVLGAAVLLLGACNGNDVDAPDEVVPGEADVQVTGTDALAFEPSEMTAEAGEITVELTSEAGVQHDFTVEVNGAEETVVVAGAGATATGTIDLEAGTYVVFCDVPGHREGGMEGTLEVG